VLFGQKGVEEEFAFAFTLHSCEQPKKYPQSKTATVAGKSTLPATLFD
jgi:hypothetical protein